MSAKKKGLKIPGEEPESGNVETMTHVSSESHAQRGHNARGSAPRKERKTVEERGVDGGYEFELNPFTGSSKARFGLRFWKKKSSE